jgi:hypothetical protein
VIAMHDLAAQLIADLRRDYPSCASVQHASAQALRDRFCAFGV